MSERLNIEELLIKKLEGLEIEPSGNAWLKTQRMLRRKQFLRFSPRKFNIFYAGGLLVAGAMLTGLLIIEDTESRSSGAEDPIVEVGVGETKADTAENVISVNEQSISYQEKTIPAEKANSEVEIVKPQEIEVSSSEDLTPSADHEVEFPDQESLAEVKTLITYFTPSLTEGCAPLAVEFVNHSENATSYQWSFGDGVSKNNDINTKNIFTKEGSYTVTLKAISQDGLQQIHSEIIIVHPKPRADFVIEDGQVYNYSLEATDFTWKFSEEKLVAKNFQPDFEEALLINPGASRLFLTAANMYGCIDTFSVSIPRPERPSIYFPTAFSPNPSGPASGYYNPNDQGNNIFYPRFTEEPSEYRLTIYNRAGELIFQSNDIHIGWDGYYREAPVLRGVYVWKCTGKWRDGTLINQQGDITALWSN